MKTLIVQHDDCLLHDPGPTHPERADRARAVFSAIRQIPGTECLPAPRASLEQIQRAHDSDYWQGLLDQEPEIDIVPLDADTFLSPGSIDATLRASGAACFAVDQILQRKARNAFCATRPPGHHAEAGTAMGFCLLNHVAIAARHSMTHPEIERVAILDFDVHHGNGTQAIFEQSPEVLYISSHQSPLYPGTGQATETGCGNILNLPLPPDSGSEEFRQAWKLRGLPELRAFNPDLIILSAGFDAHRKDPLAQINLQDDDYRWLTQEVVEVADACCSGRIVSVLEGGYDLEGLSSAAAAHVQALTA